MKTAQNKKETIKNNVILEEIIYIKSLFHGWQRSNKHLAKEWAKIKIKTITTGKNDKERLDMINNRLRGIIFNLEELNN